MPRFFILDNRIEVYEDFCSKYFPYHLNEDYKHREKFENISTEAFVGEHHDFINDIAHIYCTHNEIGGENIDSKTISVLEEVVVGNNV